MDDLDWTAILPVSDQFVVQHDTSDIIHGDIFGQNVLQNGPSGGFNQEPHPELGNHENFPARFSQNAGYNNAIQDNFDMVEFPLQSLDCGTNFDIAQDGPNVIFNDDDLGPIPLLDEYYNMTNEDNFPMLQAIGHDYINSSTANDMSNQCGSWGGVHLGPFYFSQQSEYGSTACYGGFEATNSPWTFNYTAFQPHFDFQPHVETMADWPAPQGLNGVSNHDIVSTAYLHDHIRGNVNESSFGTGLNPGNTSRNFSYSEQGPPLIQIEMSAPPVRRSKKKDGEDAGKKHRYSEADWVYTRENHLKRLMLDKHTTKEIAFELTVIHDFPTSSSTLGNKFREWGPEFRKNGSEHDGGAPRRRAAHALPSNETNVTDSVPVFLQRPSKRKPRLSPAPGPTFQAYIHQEKMFHELDNLVKGCFDKGTKSKGWTPGISSFIPPGGTADFSKSWRLLSAQCSGIALLGNAMLYNHVLFLFSKVLEQSKVATQSCDPNILVHFWTICHSLCDLRFPKCREFILLRALLRHLRDEFSKSLGSHSLVRFLDSLIKVLTFSPDDLRTTVGLAYWKTIHVLVDSGGIPRDHRIILNMGSHCTKHWKSKFKARTELLEPPYKAFLQSIEACPNTEVEQKISLLYDYTRAISRSKYNTKDVVNQAIQLRNQSALLCSERALMQRLHWTEHTQAFAFSTELVAKHCLEYLNDNEKPVSPSDDRSKGFSYMSEAINILRLGDLQCQIRAFSFSRRLGLWLKSYHGAKNAKEEKSRRLEILSRIPKTVITLSESQNLAVRKRGGGNRTTRWRRQRRMVRDTLFPPTGAMSSVEQFFHLGRYNFGALARANASDRTCWRWPSLISLAAGVGGASI